MPAPLVELALAAVASVAGAITGWRVAGREPDKRAALAALGFGLIAWPVLSDLFPDRLYFIYPALPYGESLFGAAFFLPGVLARTYADTAIRRILQGVLAVGMLYFVLAEPLWFALNADAVRRLDGAARDGVTMQTEFYSCMPSALATVLRRWGYEVSEGEAAYLVRTTFQGSRATRVPPAVETLGRDRALSARIVDASFEDLARLDRPAILIGWSGSVRHAVALLELNDQSIGIGDPLRGLVRAPRAELAKEFRWNGQAILIDSRNPDPLAPGLQARRK